MSDHSAVARRDAVRHILRTQRISTQEQLCQTLSAQGFRTTQATLSRDLARLRARRVTLQEGGSVYELREFWTAESRDELVRLRDLVTGVDYNDSLVVVMTNTAAAATVGVAIDRARLREVLGTVAGDNTLFVAPARRVSARSLAQLLKNLWKAGEVPA